MSSPLNRPAIRPWHFVAFLLAGGLAAAGISYLSVAVQATQVSPVGVISIVVGVVLGGLLAGMLRLLRLAHRPLILAGTVVLAWGTCFGQHYFFYRWELATRRQQLAEMPFPGDRQRLAQIDWWDYLRREGDTAARVVWLIDLLLITAAATGAVWVGTRTPFCDRCRSWYRVVRGGPVSDQRAAQLAAAADVELPRGACNVRFRLYACQGGCGPRRLNLKWADAGGRDDGCQVWLPADQQRATEAVLQNETPGRSAIG